MKISNKMFKRIALVCLAVIVCSCLALYFVNASEQRALEKQISEMVDSDDPETVIQGVFLKEVRLEKLKVDYIAASGRHALIEVSYAEPFTSKETARTFSIFAIDLTQRITKYGKTDSISYNFSCPFIDGTTGRADMQIAMRCELDKTKVKEIDLNGFDTLLYSNPLQLRMVTDVTLHPGFEKNLQ